MLSDISDETLKKLSTFTYRPDAEMGCCWLPLFGIWWQDELPEIPFLRGLPENDQKQILRLFGLRQQFWRGEPLSDPDQQFWDTTRSRVPGWAFFHRPRISYEELRIQAEVEQAAFDFVQDQIDQADEAYITEEDGFECVQVTFKVKPAADEEKRPWWKRLF